MTSNGICPSRNCLRQCAKIIIAIAIVSSFHTSICNSQFYRDMRTIRAEHLLTNMNGQTGDVSIYLSFPNWFGHAAGYSPIRIRVIPRKGLVFKSDGILKLSIGSNHPYSDVLGPKTVVALQIDKGSIEAHGEIIANLLRNDMVSITTTLNGRELDGQSSYFSPGASQPSDNVRNIVLISKRTSESNYQRQDALAEMGRTGNWFSQEESFVASSSIGLYADVSKMPTNWLCFNGLEQISATCDELALLSPEGLESINHYVLAGGVLAVGNVSSLAEVTNYLPIDIRKVVDLSLNRILSATDQTQLSDMESTIDFLQDTVWDKFMARSAKMLVRDLNNPRGYTSVTGSSGYVGSQISSNMDFFDFSGVIGNDLLEVGRTFLDSQIHNIELVASKLFDPTEVYKAETTGGDGLSAPVVIVHGFGFVQADPRNRRDPSLLNIGYSSSSAINRTERFKEGIGDDFWSWLISSVGRTPVISFLSFVVLFVGVVVPGLMMWCNRHKRRVWLLVMMPLTATIFTLLLFSYGILKDGLGAISRTRSLAFVDANGDGMVWSRQSYFAARVPEQGMVINSDTQLAPMLVNSNTELTSSIQLELDGKQQYKGLLPPRLQSQFSITHPLRKINVLARDSKQDPVLKNNGIINTSGSNWIVAMFVDSDGQVYVTKDVNAGEPAVLAESSFDEGLSMLRRTYQATPLQSPLDAPSADQLSLNQYFSNIFSYNRYRPNSAGLIFEEQVWMNCVGLPSSASTVSTYNVVSPRFEQLPSSYVIFLDQAPYLERCIPNAKDTDGLHTIIGQW